MPFLLLSALVIQKAHGRVGNLNFSTGRNASSVTYPVLRWNMDNIFIKRDPAGNIKPDKEKSTEKIDGSVATIMALDRAIRCGCVNGDSIYDSREMLVL